MTTDAAAPSPIQFYGSRNNKWPKPPTLLVSLLTEWFIAAGVNIPHQFWIEDMVTAPWDTNSPLFACHPGAGFLVIILNLRRGDEVDRWTLHMNWSAGISMGLYNSLMSATEFLLDDPIVPGRELYSRFTGLYELVNGLDFTTDDLTDVVATDCFFRDRVALISGLLFMARRGFFVTFVPADTGEPDRGTFRWAEPFRGQMISIVEERQERLLQLPKISIEDLVGRIDSFRLEMLERVSVLKTELHDAGSQVRIPNKFLGLTSVALEEWIGLLASAGLVNPVADHEHGILGKVWAVNMPLRQRVLDLCHERGKSSAEGPPAEPPPPLPRAKQIERELAYARSLNEHTATRIEENRRALGDVEREIFELEGRLGLARARKASLESTLSDDEGGLRANLEMVERLEIERDALALATEDAAKAAIAEIRLKALSGNLDPDALLAAIQASLTGQRPS